MKNPKTVLSIIISILSITYDLFVGDFTLPALIASLTAAVTIIWKYFKPEESIITMIARVIFIGGSLPEDDDDEDEPTPINTPKG